MPKIITMNWDKLEGYLELRSTKRTCAILMGISEDTIERHILKKYGMGFKDYADKCLTPTRLKLVQKAIEKALSGDNVMLIFCLKNLCDWVDKKEDLESEIQKVADKLIIKMSKPQE